MTATVEMVPCMLNGRYPLLLPQHRAAREEWHTGWEVERIESMRARLGPDDVVYDIGAEEGDMPGLWASWGCQVALVEPNPRVWSNVRLIWEANDLPPPVAWHVGFASDVTVPARRSDHVPVGFDEPRDGWPACAYGPVISDHGFCNVFERPDLPQVRLDDLAVSCGRPPTAITVDVEGAEWKVMRGAERLLSEVRPTVWLSEHPQFMVDSYGESQSDLHKWMEARGYRATHLATDHEVHMLWEPRP